jgi:hypothetical protein
MSFNHQIVLLLLYFDFRDFLIFVKLYQIHI